MVWVLGSGHLIRRRVVLPCAVPLFGLRGARSFVPARALHRPSHAVAVKDAPPGRPHGLSSRAASTAAGSLAPASLPLVVWSRTPEPTLDGLHRTKQRAGRKSADTVAQRFVCHGRRAAGSKGRAICGFRAVSRASGRQPPAGSPTGRRSRGT